MRVRVGPHGARYREKQSVGPAVLGSDIVECYRFLKINMII